jgi:hypothetical protein
MFYPSLYAFKLISIYVYPYKYYYKLMQKYFILMFYFDTTSQPAMTSASSVLCHSVLYKVKNIKYVFGQLT